MGLCLLSLDVAGTGAMAVPRSVDGRKALNYMGFATLQG